MIAETGSIAEIGGVAAVRACPETGGIDAGVGITLKEGIGASSDGASSGGPSSSRPSSGRPSSNRASSGRASSSIYSGGVCKWASPR